MSVYQWFSARRPGQVIEREGAASTACISYSTQSISGPSYTAAPRQKRKAGDQFHPGTDDLVLRPDDVAWVQRQGALGGNRYPEATVAAAVAAGCQRDIEEY